MPVYLVFEQQSAPVDLPGDVRVPDGQGGWTLAQRQTNPPTLLGFNAIGSVRASSPHAAAMAAAHATRRLSRYALVECNVIDFAPDAPDDSEEAVQLNP